MKEERLLLWVLVLTFGILTVVGVTTVAAAAAGSESAPDDTAVVEVLNPFTGYLAISAAIATGLGSLAAGYAVGKVGAAALGAASERPELIIRSLLFVGLAEGVAIYGLLIGALLILKM